MDEDGDNKKTEDEGSRVHGSDDEDLDGEGNEGDEEDEGDEIHGLGVEGEEAEADNDRECEAPEGQADQIEGVSAADHPTDEDDAADSHQDHQGDGEGGRKD